MQALLLLSGLLLALLGANTCRATPVVEVQLQVEPKTHAFTCRYSYWIEPTDTTTSITFNLDRQYQLRRVQAPGAARHRTALAYYPYFADTLRQLVVRYPRQRPRKARRITLTYSGTLPKPFTAEHVNVFSAHSGWLPNRSCQEYREMTYTLRVRVPTAYQVRSTTPALRHHAGHWTFRGVTNNIDITALVAPEFVELAPTATAPVVRVVKAGKALTPADSAVGQRAETICAFYNRTLGRQDPITHFTILLPGTNTDAFGLLENAAIITYTDFDVDKPEDLLILAHEISHKWWTNGSVHNEDDWLNEAFATHSSLLYVRAAGDTATYRKRLAQLTQSAAGTPALIGFNRYQYEPAMYRRVIYNKGAVVLAALCERLGTEKYLAVLAAVAGNKVATTSALVDVVAEVAGADTRAWLRAQLSQ